MLLLATVGFLGGVKQKQDFYHALSYRRGSRKSRCFLQELVYYKDSELLLLRASQIEFEEKDGKYQLSAVVQGETLDRDRHQQGVDVKAVTLHRFQLEKTNDGWTAMVILDI